MEVYYNSPWIPAEWIQTHGLVPRGTWGVEPSGPSAVAEGVCAFAQSFAHFVESCSEGAAVFATTCDQMRRAHDDLQSRHPRLFLFNIPATWQTRSAREMYHEEVIRLGRFLQRLGGHAPDPGELVERMRDWALARAQLRTVIRLIPGRKGARAVAEFHWHGHLPETGVLAGTAIAEGPHPSTPAPTAVSDGTIPIALVGGPLSASHWSVLDAIESSGGRIVLNATEFGERSLLVQPPAGDWSGHPISALTDGYFDNILDVFQRPNTRLYEWLKAEIMGRGARGLLVWSWSACDLWRAEAASLREATGLPTLLLEAGETGGASPREQGRMQAFLEMLRDSPLRAPRPQPSDSHSASGPR